MKSRTLAWLAAAILVAPAAGAETDTEAAEPAVATQPASGEVARATFTSEVVDREPQDEIQTLGNDQVRILYFTELRNLTGETVTHRWEFNGEVMAEVPVDVGGPRWRFHSSKELDPQWLGEWKVSVVDSNGRVLRTDSFAYTASQPTNQQTAKMDDAKTDAASKAAGAQDTAGKAEPGAEAALDAETGPEIETAPAAPAR